MFNNENDYRYMMDNKGLGDEYWRQRINWDNNPRPETSIAMIDRDMYYLWEMYPREAKAIKRIVEEMLDMEDYRGSFIYDEYPDKFIFYSMVRRAVDKYKAQKGENEDYTECDDCNTKWIMQIIQVILANEITRRRSKNRYW